LAISSGLALVAFVGLGPRLRNVRFTESIRGVETQVTRAVAAARSGQNNAQGIRCVASADGGVRFEQAESGSNSAGQSEDCVFNGVQILFDGNDNTLKTYQLASRREKVTGCNVQNDNKALEIVLCYGTRAVGFQSNDPVLAGTVQVYSLTNGLQQSKIIPAKPNNSNLTFVGYVIDPETNQVHTFLDEQEALGENPTRKVCYELGGRKASIAFSLNSIEPKVEFNDANC
jgi:hypothetical protein